MNLDHNNLLKIYLYPHPVLLEEARAIRPHELAYASELAEAMKRTCIQAGGAGLAAPQVGESVQMLVISEYAARAIDNHQVFINPEITLHAETYTANEGCLSLPGIIVPVVRSRSITISWMDLNGQMHTDVEVDGHAAHVLQHECDHLKGILTIHKIVGAIQTIPSSKLTNTEILNNLISGKHVYLPFYPHVSIADE